MSEEIKKTYFFDKATLDANQVELSKQTERGKEVVYQQINKDGQRQTIGFGFIGLMTKEESEGLPEQPSFFNKQFNAELKKLEEEK